MSAVLEGLQRQADALRPYAAQVYADDPVGSVDAELRRTAERLAVDWLRAPRGALKAALGHAAVRLLLAAGVDRFVSYVELSLPSARRLAAVMRPDTLAVRIGFLVDAHLPPGCLPGMRGPYVVATIVAGLERLEPLAPAAPLTQPEAAE